MPAFPVSKNKINKTLKYTLQNKGKWTDKEKSTLSVHLVCLSTFFKLHNFVVKIFGYQVFRDTQRKVNGARAQSI